MVLSAYFDDSNSHHGAELILWAGFVGYDNQWDMLENDWQAVLKSEGLPFFSGSGLQLGIPPFDRHDPSRAWADHLKYVLRNVIFDSGVFGIAAGVPHKDWRELVSLEAEQWLNPPGTVCIILCSDIAVRYARERNYNQPMSIFFDQGVEKEAIKSAVEVGQILNDYHNRSDAFGFLPVKKTPALQAADFYAWHLQSDMKSYLKTRKPGFERSPHMKPWMNRKCAIDFLETKALAKRLEMPEFRRVLLDENWV